MTRQTDRQQAIVDQQLLDCSFRITVALHHFAGIIGLNLKVVDLFRSEEFHGCRHEDISESIVYSYGRAESRSGRTDTGRDI